MQILYYSVIIVKNENAQVMEENQRKKFPLNFLSGPCLRGLYFSLLSVTIPLLQV